MSRPWVRRLVMAIVGIVITVADVAVAFNVTTIDRLVADHLVDIVVFGPFVVFIGFLVGGLLFIGAVALVDRLLEKDRVA